LADLDNYAKGQGISLAGEEICWVSGEKQGEFALKNASQTLPVGALQVFLDQWMQEHPEAMLDYIHGEDTVRVLAKEGNALGFLLPTPDKGSLFTAVAKEGVLPRKTFSMGEANEKRYYMEARKI